MCLESFLSLQRLLIFMKMITIWSARHLQEKQHYVHRRVVLNVIRKAAPHHLNPLYMPFWKQSLICRVHQLAYYGKPTCFEESVLYCFCAGPGIWNISGPPQNPGISYSVSLVEVRIMLFPGTESSSEKQLTVHWNQQGNIKEMRGFFVWNAAACWVAAIIILVYFCWLLKRTLEQWHWIVVLWETLLVFALDLLLCLHAVVWGRGRM